MTDKKKILVIQKVHDMGMKLIINNPKFDVEVTDDVSIDNLKSKISSCDAVSIRIAELPGNVINEAKNLNVSYFRKIIAPTEDEMKKHKEYLKSNLKKNYFN